MTSERWHELLTDAGDWLDEAKAFAATILVCALIITAAAGIGVAVAWTIVEVLAGGA
jgi:hypothetical protein